MRSRPRGRQSNPRVLRHNATILAAVIAVTARDGWVGLSIKAVAEQAQMSEQAVKDRHRDRVGMACAAWSEVLAETTTCACRELLVAYGLLDARGSEPLAAHAAWSYFRSDAALQRSACELLIAAAFYPGLQEAIDATLGTQVVKWLTPGHSARGRRSASRRALLLSRALVFLLLTPIYRGHEVELAYHDELVAQALMRDVRARALPSVNLPPFLSERFDDDPTIDRLLRVTLDQVARKGFHDVSLSNILDTSGATKTFTLYRFKSKLNLFVQASQRQREASLEANLALQQRLSERFDAPSIQAAIIRTILQPTNPHPLALNLQQLQLAAHEAELAERYREIGERVITQLALQRTPAEARAIILANFALAEGISLLPTLAPEAHQLPWDVVLRPLIELEEA